MPAKIDSMRELLLQELSDLHDAESQLLKALPAMAEGAEAPELRQAFTSHLEETREQLQRLDRVFSMLGAKPARMTCKGMKGLIEESKAILEEKGDEAVKDAALIAAAQRVEHYEIAGYGCARAFAELLGETEAAGLLQQSLEEERETDTALTNLALSAINVEAAKV